MHDEKPTAKYSGNREREHYTNLKQQYGVGEAED